MVRKVYSFDVFETCLVRVWAKPRDLFWALGEQLDQEKLIDISADNWQQMRIKAETVAREVSKTGEVSVEQIYQQLTRLLGWSTTQAQQSMHKEIALELASLRPVPAIQKRIQTIQQANERLIYMSDMYLSEETIRTFLKENNVWTPGSCLYVSSEVGVSKSNGKLYPHCLGQESVKASQLTHIGDNLHSDVKMAKKQGVKVELFDQAHLNRYEEKIADATQLPLKFRSLLAGASRLTRLQSQETSPDKQVIWDTTASAIAPLLFGFVHWCLVEAQKRGIQRLYFVARDGQILQKIAQVICQNWRYTIDCRYLYGSRQAWHLPAIQEIGEVELDWILSGTEFFKFVSVRSICKRVNISPEQIKDVLSRHGLPAAKWDVNLQKHERDLLRQVFTQTEVTELIISTAATYREKAINYFRQEGLDDEVPFGLVDVGWRGRIQRSFSKLLETAGIYPESGVCGFYFGLDDRVKPFQNDRLLAYFYDVDNPCVRNFICKYANLLELFVAADHGSTISYEQRDEQYIPVLRSLKNERAINWGLYVLQGAVVEFAMQITTNLSKQEYTIESFIEATEMLAKELILNPSPQEAHVFGSFTISGADQAESVFYELAPIHSLADWWRLLLYNRRPHEDAWVPASIARSNAIARKLFKPWKNSDNIIIFKIRKILGGFKRDFILKAPKTT